MCPSACLPLCPCAGTTQHIAPDPVPVHPDGCAEFQQTKLSPLRKRTRAWRWRLARQPVLHRLRGLESHPCPRLLSERAYHALYRVGRTRGSRNCVPDSPALPERNRATSLSKVSTFFWKRSPAACAFQPSLSGPAASTCSTPSTSPKPRKS